MEQVSSHLLNSFRQILITFPCVGVDGRLIHFKIMHSSRYTIMYSLLVLVHLHIQFIRYTARKPNHEGRGSYFEYSLMSYSDIF